ncbi:MAG: ester cyclase [Xanthomonadales bacterium]|nr:ester cyclase [Xanthomonadales bacterium]
MKVTYFKTVIIIIGLTLFGGKAMAQNAQEANMKLIGQFSEEVFVDKNLSNLEQYMLTDYIQHNPLVEQGSAGFKAFFSNWFTTVPDFKYTLKNIIANDEYVWVYGTYSGTHTGDWLGIPATNNVYKFDGIDIFRISNGRLAEHWDVLDVYGLFKQLGTIK